MALCAYFDIHPEALKPTDDGSPPMPLEVLEDTYRQSHHLTWWQMQDEPADAVWEWVTVQNCRMKQQEMQSRLHNTNG